MAATPNVSLAAAAERARAEADGDLMGSDAASSFASLPKSPVIRYLSENFEVELPAQPGNRGQGPSRATFGSSTRARTRSLDDTRTSPPARE